MSDVATKTYLVTGAAGFIGSHTVEALLARGDRVVGIDNFNDYYDPALKRTNLMELEAHTCASAFRFVEGDIRDQVTLARLFSECGFDVVVHLAAMAGVRASTEKPRLYYDVNLNGTLSLVERASSTGAHLVFASTSSAYGRTARIPFAEDDPADRPLAPYPASKRAAELLGHAYHHLHQLDFTALRFFTVYGPRNRPDMMAHKVLDNIFRGHHVPLYNRGQMFRDWTYVTDIVDGILRASDRRLGYAILNLGRGEPVLLADFVSQLEKLAGQSSELENRPMMEEDVEYTYADISRARDLLGYRPSVSVPDGCRRLYEWYRSKYG